MPASLQKISPKRMSMRSLGESADVHVSKSLF